MSFGSPRPPTRGGWRSTRSGPWTCSASRDGSADAGPDPARHRLRRPEFFALSILLPRPAARAAGGARQPCRPGCHVGVRLLAAVPAARRRGVRPARGDDPEGRCYGRTPTASHGHSAQPIPLDTRRPPAHGVARPGSSSPSSSAAASAADEQDLADGAARAPPRPLRTPTPAPRRASASPAAHMRAIKALHRRAPRRSRPRTGVDRPRAVHLHALPARAVRARRARRSRAGSRTRRLERCRRDLQDPGARRRADRRHRRALGIREPLALQPRGARGSRLLAERAASGGRSSTATVVTSVPAPVGST